MGRIYLLVVDQVTGPGLQTHPEKDFHKNVQSRVSAPKMPFEKNVFSHIINMITDTEACSAYF